MENAAEALQMAAAVLIFVLALTIAINSFGQARQTAQLILDNNDREYDYTYVDYDIATTKRIVSVESMIPTIYKAYRENYKIIFDGLTDDEYLYEQRNEEGTKEKMYNIDMEYGVRLADDRRKLQFIMALLYGKDMEDIGGNTFDEISEYFEESAGVYLKDDGLYDTIKGKTFEESIGVYYQEEAKGGDVSNVPEANLTQKRVITYTFQP